MRDIAHIHDPEFLKSLVTFYEETIEKLLRELKASREENARLRGEGHLEAIQQELFALEQRLNALNAKLFGASSERRTDDPASDGNSEGTSDDPDPNGKTGKKRKGHGPTPQPRLPIVDVHHPFDDPDRICPKCGRSLRTLQDQCEVSFEIDIVPARIVLKRHLQEKAGCDNGCVIETAPGPVKLIRGGRYSIDFALDVAAGRYLEHTPLERLRRRYARMGLEVSVQTLFDQLYAAARYLVPTWAEIKRSLMTREQLFGDETPWSLFDGKGSKTWYLWSVSAPDAVWYTFADSRSALISRQLLLGFEGGLQCDGLASYSALPENGGANSTREYAHFLHPSGSLVGTSKKLLSPMTPLPIQIGLCWSHARRLFLPFEKSFGAPTRELLKLIRRLYAVEDEAHKLARERAGPEPPLEVLHYQVLEARAQLRPVQSAPIIAEIKAFLELRHALPQSEFEKAKRYLSNHWPAFTLFLTEPSFDLDNNKAERSLRGPVVSRKNSYGSHSERGLLVTAVFYSLFESARLSGIEPVSYVKACLEQAIRNPDTALTPWDYAQRLESSDAVA